MRVPLYLQTIVAMVAGVAVGLLVGEPVLKLAPVSKVIIEIIKAAAIPLLFTAIFDGILRMEFRGRGLGILAFIIIVNASAAVLIALSISNLFEPGQWLPRGHLAHLSGHGMRGIFGESHRLVTHPMPISIFAALLLGAGVLILEKVSGQRPWSARLRDLSGKAFGLAARGLELLVRIVPIAVFVSVAGIAAKGSYKEVAGLAAYFGTCVGGLLLQFGVVYQAWIVASRVGLKNFWRAARTPAVYAFGVNSSLATLPLTLRGLEELGTTTASARLSACLGTNFNNDGILLYEVAAVLFVAQAYGLHLDLGQQLGIAGLCVVAMLGVGGIPEAGIISLSLVLGTVGLPAEVVPLLLTVDWFIARLRSVTNVLGDMTGAVGLDWLSGARSRPG